ncbi:MAG: hypothetical protein BWX64_02431 [Acidobacteria bacterium ADurb.Bin051]|nr:MAG: hypothetical protein BWX64_02431 [Acidobacteria bacterium ADurb.Bin051]
MEGETARERRHRELHEARLPLGELQGAAACDAHHLLVIENEQLDPPRSRRQTSKRHRATGQQRLLDDRSLHLRQPLFPRVRGGRREPGEQFQLLRSSFRLGHHGDRRPELLAYLAQVVARSGGEIGGFRHHRRQRLGTRHHDHRMRPRREPFEHHPSVPIAHLSAQDARPPAREQLPHDSRCLLRGRQQHLDLPHRRAAGAVDDRERHLDRRREPSRSEVPPPPGRHLHAERRLRGETGEARQQVEAAGGNDCLGLSLRTHDERQRESKDRCPAGAPAVAHRPLRIAVQLPPRWRQEARRHPPGGEERHLERRALALRTGRRGQREDERHQPGRMHPVEGLRGARHVEVDREPPLARLPEPHRHGLPVAPRDPLDEDRGRIGDRHRRHEEELHPRRDRLFGGADRWLLGGDPTCPEEGECHRHRKHCERLASPHDPPPLAESASLS